jgi:hypothetical protein
VFHPFQNLKAPFQNIMGGAALNIRHKAYTAGIMLVFLPIQTIFAHDGSLKKGIPIFIQKKGFLCNKLQKDRRRKEENGGGEKNREEF